MLQQINTTHLKLEFVLFYDGLKWECPATKERKTENSFTPSRNVKWCFSMMANFLFFLKACRHTHIHSFLFQFRLFKNVSNWYMLYPFSWLRIIHQKWVISSPDHYRPPLLQKIYICTCTKMKSFSFLNVIVWNSFISKNEQGITKRKDFSQKKVSGPKK